MSPPSSSTVLSPPLSSQAVRQYHETGALFPIAALSPEQLASSVRAVAELRMRLGADAPSRLFGQCHLNLKWAYDLCMTPRVLDCVEALIGGDILVHSTTLFCKPPGSKFVSWHQDAHYWGLSEPRLVSAWIALSDSTRENGCLRVQLGTHASPLEHHEAPDKDNLLGTGVTASAAVDERQAVDVELAAGQMSLHHANLLHSSSPNRSETDRVGLAIRYLAADVRQRRPHHAVVLARGKCQHMGLELLRRPPTSLLADALPAHLQLSEEIRLANWDQIDHLRESRKR